MLRYESSHDDPYLLSPCQNALRCKGNTKAKRRVKQGRKKDMLLSIIVMGVAVHAIFPLLACFIRFFRDCVIPAIFSRTLQHPPSVPAPNLFTELSLPLPRSPIISTVTPISKISSTIPRSINVADDIE